MKYDYKVYSDVKEYFKENMHYTNITDEEIDELEPSLVLEYWLEWNGIFGYASTILDILHYGDIKRASHDLAVALSKLGRAL